MTRRRTVIDLLWPDDSDEFANIAKLFGANVVRSMLEATWAGYDSLRMQMIDRIDITMAEDELERTLTQLLEQLINDALTGEEPYYIQHGPYENETREPAPAQPPQYDIAFILYSNRRIMWPLEAKVLKTDGTVSDYANSVKDNFLTGRYAPFVDSGAMLGYLLTGNASTTLMNISVALQESFQQNSDFVDRPHQVSTHNRVPRYPRVKQGPFQCHHLIMEM
ncbi:MAG: hypothetical protein OXG05_02390 [Gammaproteobacteria bacterium]|nr:hypothetical protein [Gammaproteobacteria bacterium]